MPLTLKVGFSKNCGGPDNSTLETTCHVDVELDEHLPSRDPDEFHRHVQQAVGACVQVMQDELVRQAAAR